MNLNLKICLAEAEPFHLISNTDRFPFYAADLRQMKKDNDNPDLSPRRQAPSVAAYQSPRGPSNVRDDLFGPPPAQTTSEGELSHARGGHGIFGLPKVKKFLLWKTIIVLFIIFVKENKNKLCSVLSEIECPKLYWDLVINLIIGIIIGSIYKFPLYTFIDCFFVYQIFIDTALTLNIWLIAINVIPSMRHIFPPAILRMLKIEW